MPPGLPFCFVAAGGDLGPEREDLWRSALQTYQLGDLNTSYNLLDSLVFDLAEARDVSPAANARASLAFARLLESRYRYDEATTRVNHIIETLNPSQHAELVAQAYLLKELIYEIIGQEPAARAALEATEQLLHRHKLVALSSTYYIRAASFERILGDSSRAVAYVDSALLTAPKYGNYMDYGDAYFLKAVVQEQRGSPEMINSLRRAAEIDDFAGKADTKAWRYCNILRVMVAREDYDVALSMSDTVQRLMREAQNIGFQVDALVFTLADERAKIFNALGRLDSAYACIKQARESELAFRSAFNSAEVLRVERAFARQQLSQNLAEREAEIAASTQRRNRLLVTTGVLSVLGLVLTIISVRLFRARRRVSIEVERQAVLRDELQHRVKNNFQILISFLELQAERSSEPAVTSAFEAMAKRVHNLAAIHAQLHDDPSVEQLDLYSYANNLIQHFQDLTSDPAPLQVTLEADALRLPARVLTAIGVIINELLTNSSKHAMPLNQQPIEANLSLRKRGKTLVLTYSDSGAPQTTSRARQRVSDTNSGHLGMYLIHSMVRQLEGRMRQAERSASGHPVTILLSAREIE